MLIVNLAEQLVHGAAGKHFVGFAFRTIPNGQGKAAASHAVCSAFIVDAEGICFLITAGHVINAVRENIRAGHLVDQFELLDMAAGSGFDYGLPIPFNIDEWAIFDGDPYGTDYAAWAIPPFIVAGLRKGGIKPISEQVWTNPGHAPAGTWFLVGAPRELQNLRRGPRRRSFNLSAIPLDVCDPPEHAPNREKRHFAKLRTPPEGVKPISDVDGMSGGPIYEVAHDNKSLTYWLIGVQSSWFPQSRIVSFSPAGEFLDSLVQAVRKARVNLEADGSASHPQ